MTVRRILFRGNKTACAKYLPFAKHKLKTLSKTHERRHSWTWERVFGDVTISLEENGPIQWIRIKAGLVGYEFVTITDPLIDIGQTYTSSFTIAVTGTIQDEDALDPPTAPRIGALIAKNRNGTRLKPSNNDREIDNRDRWIRAGRYDPLDADVEEEGLSSFLYPTHDWFQVEHPLDDQAALLLADGTPRLRIMHWDTWRQRHVDASLWTDSLGPILAYPGEVFNTTPGGRTRLTGLSSWPAVPSDPNQWPRNGGAAIQDGIFMCASWNGHDFLFEARNENYVEYITGSVNFQVTKPTWISAGEQDVLTHWYWRGDGKRCVSLQYAKTERPDDPDLQTPANYDPDIDAGFVELQMIVDQPLGDEAPGLPNITIENQQNNLWNQGIHPLAIDYRMLDSRKKLAYYLKTYIGPTRVSGSTTTPYPDTFYKRDLLIYLVCAEIDDAFPGEEQWRIPVWHSVGWAGFAAVDPEPPDNVLLQRVLLDGVYWTTDIGFPGLTQDMTDASDLPIHPYSQLRAVVQGMDCRAEALAVEWRVNMYEPHTIDTTPVDTVPWFGKQWRIWGDIRQDTWINPDVTTAYDQPQAGLQASYTTWFNADPSVWEEAEPPEPDPSLPPGDFRTYLASLPAGYEEFNATHAYNFKRVYSGIVAVMSVIEGQMVYLSRGAGDFSPYRSYQGFRIAPTKSFSLLAGTRPNYRWINETSPTPEADNGEPLEWHVFDHIEKNRGPEEPLLTETHGDLYNSSRGGAFDWQTRIGNLNVAAAVGLWVE